MRTCLIGFILLFHLTEVYSQEKLEREYRIKRSEVPKDALNYVKNTFRDAQLKWYGEENLKGKAIEAKGKYDGKTYSIKFNPAGELVDIEMLLNYTSIPESTRQTIEKNLAKLFSRFRIGRTQMQWVGNKAVLAALVNGESTSGPYTTNYEITLQGTKDRRTQYYEVLANHKGELIRESKIVQRNNHHLIY